ncbi:MAG: hypothetical protein ACHQ0Y_04985 [Thermodesulfovibrionales bacterium]
MNKLKQLAMLYKDIKAPVVVAYGMGIDSTALLAGLVMCGQRPDLILFADTGAERRETYDFKPVIQEWLKKEGFPPIVTVKYQAKNFKNYPPYHNLETNLLTNGTLPGVSFGPASCSSKWKQGPQHDYIKKWDPARLAWSVHMRVIKLIGFDDSPADRRRTYSANPKDTHLYEYRMPLQEWGWDREECKKQIQRAGLPLPIKSSCFFCVAVKPHELDGYPLDLLRRIVRLEARAHPRLRSCEGLWRSTVKGTRGGIARPGSMTKYIREKKLLPAEEVDYIWHHTFKDIVTFQEGFARAKEEDAVDEFLSISGQMDYRDALMATEPPLCEAA